MSALVLGSSWSITLTLIFLWVVAVPALAGGLVMYAVSQVLGEREENREHAESMRARAQQSR